MTHPLKDHARRLRAALAVTGMHVTHAQALDLTARAHGFESWRTLTAARYSVTPVTLPVPELPGRFTLEFTRSVRETAVHAFTALDWPAAVRYGDQLELDAVGARLTWEAVGEGDEITFDRLVPEGEAPLVPPAPEDPAPPAAPRPGVGVRYVAHLERWRTERARVTVDALGVMDATEHWDRFVPLIDEQAWVPTEEVSAPGLLSLDADLGSLGAW